MAQGSLPNEQEMEVELRQQLDDVFGKFDDFAGIIGGAKQLFGVVPTSGVMRGLTPYSTNRLPPNAALPSATLCLQEMKNVPPLIPPLQVNRNEIENSGCASEASSSNSHMNDDENYNRAKKRKRDGIDEDGDGTTKRREKREDNKIIRDLFDDDNDDEKEDWRDRVVNMPRQGIKRMIEEMQVQPLLSPIDADRILKKNEDDDEREERERRKRKEREESEKRRKDKTDDEDRKRKREGDEDRRKDERRRRKEDDERKRKRDDEEREKQKKSKEVDEKRKRKDESEREEEERRIRKEKKRMEKEEKRQREEEERMKKEEERERRRKEEEEERRKRLEKEEEMKREKENREREELANKIEEEKKREAERIRNEEDKRKEAERMRREEEARKREIEDRRKKEEDERKKKEEEDKMRKEKKKEEEKRKQKEEEKEKRRKEDLEKGRKEKDKKGSLPLDTLPNFKLEALKEKEKERRRKEKIILNESKDERNSSLSLWDEKKKKEFKEEKAKEKKVKEERIIKKEVSSARSSPMSSKNSSRVATPIPPISLPSTSTHNHVGASSPSCDARFSFPHCPSSVCLAGALAPQSPPTLEQRPDFEGYKSYAKEKKHRGDATPDRVLRYCHYMESCMYFCLSVSTIPPKSADRELSMAGCVLKDTIDLIKHASFLFEKEGMSHMTSRTKLLCIRTQAILNYHMYYFKASKFPRRSDALTSLESQVQEVPRASPRKEENGSGGKNIGDKGDKNVTPSPSSSSLASNSNSMVTMPMSLWKMKSSQVLTYNHLEIAHTLWNDSMKHLTSNERHYWNTIDNLIIRKFDWGCPLHIGSSLIHLSHFINIAVCWMREEYEAEKSR